MAGPRPQSYSGAGGMKLNLPEETAQIWDDVMSDTNETTWLVLEYDASGKNLLLKDKGTGGLTNFKVSPNLPFAFFL